MSVMGSPVLALSDGTMTRSLGKETYCIILVLVGVDDLIVVLSHCMCSLNASSTVGRFWLRRSAK
jgi:hypothetical protein